MSTDSIWPISFEDVLAARERLRPHLSISPLLEHPLLNEAVGHGVRVFVKHENHLPTGAFKARNGMSALSALTPEERQRGVVAATRGNHGQGLAWAGQKLGITVTVCVPLGNNPEKNAAIRAYGATLVERGVDYDDSLSGAQRLAQERGLREVPSTNEPQVIAGAATMTLEMLEQQPNLEALVFAVGGGSQAVGALTVVRRLRPELPVYAVQAAEAAAAHDSWHAGRPLTVASAQTFADGLATRGTYALTFEALRAGLADFVTVTEAQLADAVRLLLRTTHNLAEGAGAAGLAGLMKLRERLAGKRVGIVISGGNIDQDTLRRVLLNEI
jgi:threonine dehydratase